MENYVTITGAALLVIGLSAVFFKREVSTGQSLIFAFGAALVALPQLTNFEWSEGTLKFTTRTETVQITEQIKAISQQQTALSANVVALTDAVGKITEQVEAIETAIRATQPSSESSLPAFKPSDWQRLRLDSERLIDQSNSTFRTLETLQQDMMVAPKQ
ncbi:hypothetical protein MRS76_23180 [Rhizobiaceae bacterium n13]|uniref:Uncharacterized protein n=1 Tax=Ferirhizobium litorale TaxID=2927786 RepID=A0AAE3U254_9HYPH|nr:hypothetical protein [Fererhizobium litorale]MDI7864834.1 hypothetical protein [Fererhizobium litorale]MDI7923156.1 hypothetical protein [Fererhizobium litorale]